jgi:hypothetical protein
LIAIYVCAHRFIVLSTPYKSGMLGIFGTGWETTVLVDNELAILQDRDPLAHAGYGKWR